MLHIYSCIFGQIDSEAEFAIPVTVGARADRFSREDKDNQSR